MLKWDWEIGNKGKQIPWFFQKRKTDFWFSMNNCTPQVKMARKTTAIEGNDWTQLQWNKRQMSYKAPGWANWKVLKGNRVEKVVVNLRTPSMSPPGLTGVSLTPSHRDCDKNTIFPDDYISEGWLWGPWERRSWVV